MWSLWTCLLSQTLPAGEPALQPVDPAVPSEPQSAEPLLEPVSQASTAAERWAHALADWAPRGLAGVVVIAAFWLAGVFATLVILRVGMRSRLEPVLLRLIARIARATLVVIGIISGLGTMGVNVGALVAGLGLTGFALGFALRDTLSNLIAGVMLLVYRPFTVEDRVAVAGAEGRVIQIDLRYTTIQGQDKRVLIPNATLLSNAVTILEPAPSQP